MLEAEIQAASEEHEVPVSLIKAICRKESNFITWASRYEPGWKYFLDADKITEFCKKTSSSVATEKIHQATSWGLMQVMGTVARELGYEGHLPALCLPEIGLFYGVKKLKKCLSVPGRSVMDAIAAYNAGTPVVINGKYKNQEYVDAVMKFYREYNEPLDS